MFTVIIFLVILSLLVLIHELGHFLVAKRFGIKVEEFGFGFPPKVFGIRRGETLYTLNLLPIGGFVKLYGEDEAGSGKLSTKSEARSADVKDIDRAFFARPILQRALVIVAGVLMNLALAYVVIVYLYTYQGVITPNSNVTVSQVIKGSPAQIAGLKEKDQILSINSEKISSTNQLVATTRGNLGKKITLVVNSNGQTKTVAVTPRKNFPKDQGPMGVAVSQGLTTEKYPLGKSLIVGAKRVANDSYQVVVGFKSLLVDIATRLTIPQGVAGPIGMAQLTGEVVKFGPAAVLSLVYTLSLSLAVLNILPIPALDGGRFFFILIEAVTRRKVNPKFEAYANAAGIAILLAFLAVVSYKDIVRIVSHQSILPQ